jgi:hypothetical protein
MSRGEGAAAKLFQLRQTPTKGAELDRNVVIAA